MDLVGIKILSTGWSWKTTKRFVLLISIPNIVEYRKLHSLPEDPPSLTLRQYAYASQLVYIPTLCFAKLSTLFYLRALTPDSNYAIFNRLTEICVILWALSAEFSILFQCNMPNPWAVLSTGKCFNIVS